MRFSIATLLVAVVCLTGCRQTTGVNSAGPLSPISPLSPTAATGSLTPMSPGQMPALGPFGGTTRVTPPSTGSYAAPNNYMGGADMSYQVNPPMGVAQNNTASGWNPPPIGSGVQQTGAWSAPNQPATGFAPGSGYAGSGYAPSQSPIGSGIRSQGMQVHDLTGAPSPPGYQPPLRNTIPLPNQQAPALAPAPVPQNNAPATWQPPQVIVAPSQANIAAVPSTEPINRGQFNTGQFNTGGANSGQFNSSGVGGGQFGGSQANGGEALQWRRPQSF